MKPILFAFAIALIAADCNSKSTENAAPVIDSLPVSDTVKPEPQKLTPLTASDFVSSHYDKGLEGNLYNFGIKESVLKSKGFTRKGNKWTRADGDAVTTIVKSGEAMDEAIEITFGTADECKAFIKTIPETGLEPYEYGPAGTYASGAGDMDIIAITSDKSVTFSY